MPKIVRRHKTHLSSYVEEVVVVLHDDYKEQKMNQEEDVSNSPCLQSVSGGLCGHNRLRSPLLFPSPAAYIHVDNFLCFFINLTHEEVYFLDPSIMIDFISWSLELQTVFSKTPPVHR